MYPKLPFKRHMFSTIFGGGEGGEDSEIVLNGPGSSSGAETAGFSFIQSGIYEQKGDVYIKHL